MVKGVGHAQPPRLVLLLASGLILHEFLHLPESQYESMMLALASVK